MKENTLKRFSYLTVASLPLIGNAAITKENSMPNIVIICPDQFRQESLGFWSKNNNNKYIQGKADPVVTPTLDKLASEGVVFNRVMSNFPLSSPFRGMLLSGMYPDKNGITGNCHKSNTSALDSNAVCLSDVLLNSGYETAYFGKCHWVRTEPLFDTNGTYIGTTDKPGGNYINAYDTYVPVGKNRHGYKYFFQTLRDTHKDPLVYSNDPATVNGLKDGQQYQPKMFSAELESGVLIDYLQNNRNQRDRKKPFFITWSLNPPHNPWNEKNTDMKFFPQYNQTGKPDLNKLLLRQNADSTVGNYAPYYFANVSAVDYYIGQVLDELKKQGLDKNTIIIFCSDHGEMLGSHGLTGKNTPEIEAFNIPFIVKWDGKLKHSVNDLMLSTPDIMPTLLGLIGLDSKIPTSVQGKNYKSFVSNPTSNSAKKPKSALYIGYHARGVYTGRYTFVVNEEKGKLADVFLWDNVKDPYQLNKIPESKIEPKLLHSLKSELIRLLKSTEDKWYTQKMFNQYFNY